MSARIWLRGAALLQGLGAVLHTLASQHRNAPSGDVAVFQVMQSYRFQIMGFDRTYWDFFRGYEVSITIVFAMLAVLMWQVGSLSNKRHALPIVMTLLVAQVLLDLASWNYFFAGPGVMGILIILCLAIAALDLQRSQHPV